MWAATGREDVSPVEGGGHGLKAQRRGGDLDRLDDAAATGGGQRQQAVVRSDENAVVRQSHRDGPPLSADVGIDHRQVNPGRHVRKRTAEDQRPAADVVSLDPMRDVDYPRLGTDRGDHAVTHTDEVVLQTVVGEEGDDRGTHRSLSPRP